MTSSASNSYGILKQKKASTAVDIAVEQVRTIGYAVLDSGYSKQELINISNDYNAVHREHLEKWGASELKNINEHNTVRLPLSYSYKSFLNLACNDNIIAAVSQLIRGTFLLNQQNCVSNPPSEDYNQSAWHRDLPYQHYTSSTPLAINALFCVDDFTCDNGASFVLPATHKSIDFPSDEYIERNKSQIEAKSGSILLLDCMLFHRGGFNSTKQVRRAINHVYTIPYMKQQINIPANIERDGLTQKQEELLGFPFNEPQSVADYFSSRQKY